MPQGPSSSQTPYIIAAEPNVRFTSIATVGDVLDAKPDGSPYVMVGIPDGLGAFDNGDGTLTLLMNHELPSNTGVVREHGAIGAFVSQLTIDKSTLAVTAAEDAIKSVQLFDDLTESFVETTFAIGRLCSADLAAPSAYFNAATGLGTTDRIFLAGEEIGSEGKNFGVVVTGADAGKAFELAYMGLFSWENSVSSPVAQDKTISICTDDSTGGQVYVYVGEKQATGNAMEKAGLVGGDLFGIKVEGVPTESNGIIANGSFSLQQMGVDGDVSKLTGVQLEAESMAEGVTAFLRPEDVHWDPTNPNAFYFATTNAFDNPSRLYKATFADINDPLLGGTIEAVLDGTEGQQMLDNLTVNGDGKVILQEDVGFNPFLSRVLEYDPTTDSLTVLGIHDPARFAPPPMPPFTIDEESSGVIDVTDLLGDADTKAYLLDVQAHYPTDIETVQGGQLLAMFVDTPVTDGAAGDDILFGSAADETFSGRAGNDTVDAGSGADTLNGAEGDDTLNAGGGDDLLRGGQGADTLAGSDGADTLSGGIGDDTLDGGAGADTLNGGDGTDSIMGGAGSDRLTGGDGADRFVFADLADSLFGASDLIRDFDRGEGDLIDLSAIDAVAGEGDDAFVLVRAFSGAAGELVITRSGGSTLLLGDVTGDGVADLEITVAGRPALSDFDLVL